jgi:hypothetical protein
MPAHEDNTPKKIKIVYNFGYNIWRFGTKIVKTRYYQKKMIMSNESMTKCVVWCILETACSVGVTLHIIVGASLVVHGHNAILND